MSEQDNIRLVQEIYRDFMAGDIPGTLKRASADIDWNIPKVENVPFTGRRRGRDQAANFFTQMRQHQDVLEFKPEEFTAQGDRVVVTGRYRFRVKDTGRDFATEFAHLFTIRDGTVTAFQEYTDTHAIASAYAASTVSR